MFLFCRMMVVVSTPANPTPTRRLSMAHSAEQARRQPPDKLASPLPRELLEADQTTAAFLECQVG
jgi:hypothetical protein